MLVSDLLSSIRARMRQRGSTSTHSDSDLIDYINEVLLEISSTLEYERKLVSSTTDSNGRIYLPEDALRIEYVGRNGVEISPLTPREMALNSNNLTDGLGGWFGYQFVNGYLQLGTSGDTVTIKYIARLPRVENVNQDLQIREEYRMPIIFGAVTACLVELGQNDKAAYFENKYRQELDNRREQIRHQAFKIRRVPSMPTVEL